MCWSLGTDEYLSHNSSSSICWEAQIGFQSRLCPFWWILLAVELCLISAANWYLDKCALFLRLFGNQRLLNDYVKNERHKKYLSSRILLRKINGYLMPTTPSRVSQRLRIFIFRYLIPISLIDVIVQYNLTAPGVEHWRALSLYTTLLGPFWLYFWERGWYCCLKVEQK